MSLTSRLRGEYGSSHDAGQELGPLGYRRDLHIRFVVPGRSVRLAREPRCGECALLELWDYGQRAVGAAA